MKCPKCSQDKAPDQFYWRNGRPRTGEGCKRCRAVRYPTKHADPAREHEYRRNRNEKSRDKAAAHRSVWTDEDDSLVAEFYTDPGTSVEDLAATLGRTVLAVTVRANRLRKRNVQIQSRTTACTKNLPQGENA